MTILLLEDEAASRFAMRDYFLATGHAVECARDLAEALVRLEHERFSLVVVDLSGHPGEPDPGLDAVSALRALDPEVRLIMLAASVTPEGVAEARRRGVDRVLAKPVPLPLLSRLALEPGDKVDRLDPTGT